MSSSSQQHSTQYWHHLPDGRVQCDVCPRGCRLKNGQRGLCFVRAAHDNKVVLTSYGRSSGFCIDPVEKKPLNHFYPGSSVLSFGTVGCNLGCRFCQNWDISKAREMDTLQADASPDQIADLAKGLNCKSVAFTYNDPVIFMESEQMYGDKGEVPEEEYLIPIGKADVKKTGKDVTVVSFGKIIKEVYAADQKLKENGIDIEIIDIMTVRPLDFQTIIESVKKTNRLVIVEEAWPFGNVSTEITYQVQNQAFDYLDAPVVKVNTADTPAPYSPVLLKEWLPNHEDVINAVNKVLYK